MSYVQGFVVPVPRDQKAAYIALAKKTADIFKSYGVVSITENWCDKVESGSVTDFNKAVQATPEEAIVFSWMVWPDKETCDKAAANMQDDPRFEEMGPMPFDGKRLIYAGFDTIFTMD